MVPGFSHALNSSIRGETIVSLISNKTDPTLCRFFFINSTILALLYLTDASGGTLGWYHSDFTLRFANSISIRVSLFFNLLL